MKTKKTNFIEIYSILENTSNDENKEWGLDMYLHGNIYKIDENSMIIYCITSKDEVDIYYKISIKNFQWISFEDSEYHKKLFLEGHGKNYKLRKEFLDHQNNFLEFVFNESNKEKQINFGPITEFLVSKSEMRLIFEYDSCLMIEGNKDSNPYFGGFNVKSFDVTIEEIDENELDN